MEQLDQENIAEKKLKINIVRHGHSSYRQPEWKDIDTANDLNTLGRYSDEEKTEEDILNGKNEAIEMIKKTAEEIAKEIEPDEEIIIWSSPTGRTLETAKIISKHLQDKGIQLRKNNTNDYGISIFEKLGEVKNFSWPLFEPLMNGGEVILSENKFNIDKSLSNPDNLDYPEYFTSDAIKKIPENIKSQWPKNFVDEIEKFESFAEANKRMIDTLGRLKKIGDKKYRVIIVTHDSLTGGIVKTFTNDDFSGINPGQLISLERRNDKLIATRVGNLSEKYTEKEIQTE